MPDKNIDVFIANLPEMERSMNDSHLVSLPEPYYKHLQCSTGKLKVGQKEIKTTFVCNPSHNRIELSDALMKETGLFKGMKVSILVDGETLRLGPLIGILTNQRYIRKLNKQQPSFRTLELWKANQEASVVFYYFGVRDVQYQTETVLGTFFNNETKMWEQKVFPLPDVLYDRASGRAYRKYPKHVILRKWMDERKIKRLNAIHYLDKWQLYQKLSKYKDVRPYLPETRLYEPVAVKKMLKRYPAIYLKATVSSRGKRVMRLSKDGKYYRFSVFRKSLESGILKKPKEIDVLVSKFFGDDTIIMQQAIPLVQIDDGNVDMRATVQRNGEGNIEINSIAVRLGVAGSPITSTRSGSRVIRLDEFLKDNGAQFPPDTKKRIREFLFAIYRRIEDSYGPFGEMGIDFGLDSDGKIYFIEANSKPAKDSLYKSFDDKTVRRAFLNPLNYAKFISGFSQ